jgi:lipopolysaccharide export system protein LptC
MTLAPKFYDGKQYIYLFILFIVLGFSGSYYLQSSFKNNRLPKSVLAYLPDIVVEDLTVTQFNEKGLLAHYFHTPQLIHYPHQNFSQFIQPQIILVPPSENNAPWTIRADKGESKDGVDKITLIDNVVFHQDASGTEKEKTISTSEITYYPQKDWAVTHKMIIFEEPGLRVQSQGMTAQLKKQQIHLLQQVSTTYVPNDQNEF